MSLVSDAEKEWFLPRNFYTFFRRRNKDISNRW